MTDKQTTRVQRSPEWLKNAAKAEDQFSSISVGGLVTRMGLYPVAEQTIPMVFGELVNLIRRKFGLSIEQFALLAKVDVSDVERTERNFPPDTDLVKRLAEVLQLPATKLEQLSGISPLLDDGLAQAAERFELKMRSALPLSTAQELILNEFVQAMKE